MQRSTVIPKRNTLPNEKRKMTEISETTLTPEAVVPQQRKYLTFHLGEEQFALEIERIQEIIGVINVTALPRTEDYVRGVINLRGRIIPVIDLRRRFSMPFQEDTERTCFIVGELAGKDGNMMRIGLAVDEVAEVVDIDSASIQDTEEFAAHLHGDFLKGIGLLHEQVKLLLDLDKVISHQKASLLAKMGSTEKIQSN